MTRLHADQIDPDYSHRLCVAPMMDWTDRHCRYFHRLLAPSARLYTEMVTTGALLHGDQPRHLDFDPAEHPLALQLGGSDPFELAECARLAQQWGYDEVNLNVGCPSDRVQRGAFGACLMREPELVRDCLAAMREAVDIPVTIKTRLGVDELDSWEFFADFIRVILQSGITTVIVHARKAWLSGLSPKQNRDIPPLQYERVQRLKAEYPDVTVITNGGITDMQQIQHQLQQLDGVMLGRAAYQTPWLLAQCDAVLRQVPLSLTRLQGLEQMVAYTRQQMLNQVPARSVGRHLLGLYHGQPGARSWRRWMSDCLQRNADPEQWLRPLQNRQMEQHQAATGQFSANQTASL